MKVKYKYSSKEFLLKPFNTGTEKEILLVDAVGSPSIEDILELCGIEQEIFESITREEKIAMLLKLREISVGSEINLSFRCSHCDSPNENVINIENIIQDSCITNGMIKDAFMEVTSETIYAFLPGIDVDELDVDKFDSLFNEVKNTVTKFNFDRETICQKCSKVNIINVNNDKFIIENMSEDSLLSMYQIYNDMVFHGNYTKTDVDSLYPFERTILAGLLNKTREDLNG